MLEDNDHANLWQAINWLGELTDAIDHDNDKPSDDAFKTYFEDIFNPPNVESLDENGLHTQVTILVLDEPIIVNEVETHIKRLKSNKAGGPDGLPPALFKWLPDTWIMFFATLLNTLFMTGTYPTAWIDAKMFTIFKRGLNNQCDQHSG